MEKRVAVDSNADGDRPGQVAPHACAEGTQMPSHVVGCFRFYQPCLGESARTLRRQLKLLWVITGVRRMGASAQPELLVTRGVSEVTTPKPSITLRVATRGISGGQGPGSHHRSAIHKYV
jgi:hypothetical protein